MQHAKDSRKMSLTVQNIEHLASVTVQEVLVELMRAYDLVLELPWFRAWIPHIHWNLHRLTALKSPYGPEAADILCGEYKPPPEAHEKLPKCEKETPAPDIQLLVATAFDHLLAGEEIVEGFALRIGECTCLLVATTVITKLSGEKPRRWT